MEILTLETKKEILNKVKTSVTLIAEYSNLKIDDLIGLLTTNEQLTDNSVDEFKVDITYELNIIKGYILKEGDSFIIIELFDYLIQKIEEFIKLNTQIIPTKTDVVDISTEPVEITDSEEIIQTHYSFDEIITILEKDYNNPMINKCKFKKFLTAFEISKVSTGKSSHTQYYIDLNGRDIRFLSTPLANKPNNYQVHFVNILNDIKKKCELAPQINEPISTMINNGVRKLYKKI